MMNSGDRAAPCGRLLPNDLGLFDMLGDVYEWCQDRNTPSDPSKKEVLMDIIAADEAILDNPVRMSRGGSFRSTPSDVRSAAQIG